jgi:hypothetical protein
LWLHEVGKKAAKKEPLALRFTHEAELEVAQVA